MNCDAELAAADATWTRAVQFVYGSAAWLMYTRVRLPPLTASVQTTWQVPVPLQATAGAASGVTLAPFDVIVPGTTMLLSTVCGPSHWRSGRPLSATQHLTAITSCWPPLGSLRYAISSAVALVAGGGGWSGGVCVGKSSVPSTATAGIRPGATSNGTICEPRRHIRTTLWAWPVPSGPHSCSSATISALPSTVLPVEPSTIRGHVCRPSAANVSASRELVTDLAVGS